ncbi:MAG TPA: hypothetical protein VJS20_02465 [Gemmatimonadales bacterium]|nr:hypothetical protein [Gemmatimonadales bacterium]
MSRGFGICLLLTVAGVRGAAQTPRNLERLRRMWESAAAASGRVDSLARLRLRIGLDSIRAGNLVILAPAELHALATAIAPRVWTRVEAVYGEDARTTTGALVVGIYYSDSGPPPYGFPIDAVPVAIDPAASEERNAAQVETRIPDKIRARLDPQLNGWLSQGITLRPARYASPDLYEELVTSPSPLARSCFVGDLTACRSALGLAPAIDAATEWYDAPGRRALVRNLRRDPQNPVWYEQCVEQAVDVACIHILRGPDSIHTSAPLNAGSRELLVRLALAEGGPLAFHRLLGSAGRSLKQRLEITSGVSSDSLLGRWHATVVANRPEPVMLTAGTGWVALVWALALGALVLRSSRWRS